MMGTRGLVHRVEELMRLYGEVWTTKDKDRLGEIFSDDIRYIEKPERVMNGIVELREYWSDHVGLMEETLYEPLYDEFDVSDEGSWAWVKFRAGFKKPHSHRKANQWVARLTINQAGLVCVFEEYWSRINWKVVGLEEWLTKTVLVSASQDVHRCVSLAKLACEPLLRERAFATTSLLAVLQKCAGEAQTSGESMLAILSNGADGVSATEFTVNFQIHASQLVSKKEVTKEDLLSLFRYIDTDLDGHICLSDLKNAMNMRYVCKRRIGITDCAEIVPGVEKNICVLDEGDTVSSLGMPFHITVSGTTLTRVKCQLPESNEIGFATISGTHGRIFLEIDSPTFKLLRSACQALESALQSAHVLEEALGAECTYIEEADSPALLAKIASQILLLHSTLTQLKSLLNNIHLKIKDCTTSSACKIERLQVEANAVLQICTKLTQNLAAELTTHLPQEDADECIMLSGTPQIGETSSIRKVPQPVLPSTARPKAKAINDEQQKTKNIASVVSKCRATPFELQMKAFQNALTSCWPHHLGASASCQAPPSCSWPLPGGVYGTQLAWHTSGNPQRLVALSARNDTRVISSSSSSQSSTSAARHHKKRSSEPRKSKSSKKHRHQHRSPSPCNRKKCRRRSLAPSASLYSESSSSPDREQRKAKSSKKSRHRSSSSGKLRLRSVARSDSLKSKSSSRSHRRSVSRSLKELPEILAPSISGILVLE